MMDAKCMLCSFEASIVHDLRNEQNMFKRCNMDIKCGDSNVNTKHFNSTEMVIAVIDATATVSLIFITCVKLGSLQLSASLFTLLDEIEVDFKVFQCCRLITYTSIKNNNKLHCHFNFK